MTVVRRARALLVAAQLAALVWVGHSLARARGFPLDDAWIYQVVARNLAEFRVWGFTPGVPSSGATSVLWTLVLATNQRVFHVEPVVFTDMVNTLTFVAFGQIVFAIMQRDEQDEWRSLALSIAATCTGGITWLALSGMEATLVATWTALAVWLWLGPATRATAAGTGLVLALSVLTRIDCAGLALVLLFLGRDRSRSHRALAASIAGAGLFATFLVHRWTQGSFVPLTMAGRRWIATDGGATPWWQGVAHLLESWLSALFQGATSLAYVDFRMLAVAIAGVAVVGVASAKSGLRVLGLLTLVHVVTFAVVLPSTGHAGRYQPLGLALFLPFVLLGAERMARRRVAARVTVALVVACGLFSLVRWSSILAVGVRHIEGTHRQMGAWLRGSLPDARVAAFDIGGIAYESHRPIVDLGGLVDPAYLPYLRERRVSEYLRKRGVGYVVLADDARGPFSGWLREGLGLDLAHGVLLTEVASFASDRETWLTGYRFTQHAARRQTLYRVEPAP